MQALCLQPILVSRIKRWAGASGGYLCCARSRSRVDYVRLKDSDQLEVKWSGLKRVSRAIEKSIRSYGQDVSRLLDICRQAIVFEGFRDLSACLGLIAADPDVQILRIKNRLDPDYDASASGGYRDVNINLRLRTGAARRVGVDSHVCEVQLLLLDMALLKSSEGHQHYVSGRNLRGD
jgi:hypothetical protein